MLFLIAQIFVCLLVSGLLGALAGWLVRDMVAARSQRQLQDAWRRELRESEALAGTFKNQLAEARQTEESLRAELTLARGVAARKAPQPDAETETVSVLRQELADRDKKIELLNLQVTQSQASVASEWLSIKTLKTDLSARQSRLEAGGKRRGEQWAEKLAQQEAIQRKQQGQLAALQQQNARLEEDLAASKQTLGNERQRSARRVADLEKLRRKLADREAAAQHIRPAPEDVASSSSTKPVRPSKPEPATDATVSSSVAPAPAEKDNLEQIRGIGPVLHRKLNEVGVTSFRQIASWTEDDIDQVSSQLGAFRGRIRRDNWVEKASELLRAQSSS